MSPRTHGMLNWYRCIDAPGHQGSQLASPTALHGEGCMDGVAMPIMGTCACRRAHGHAWHHKHIFLPSALLVCPAQHSLMTDRYAAPLLALPACLGTPAAASHTHQPSCALTHVACDTSTTPCMCAAGDPSPFSTASAQDPDYRYGPDPMLEIIAQVRPSHWKGCPETR